MIYNIRRVTISRHHDDQVQRYGYNTDMFCTELKRRYLPSESVVGLYGEVIKRPISTSKLNTAQFTAYLEKVQVLASSELGIVLPVPEDRIFEEFYEQYENRI